MLAVVSVCGILFERLYVDASCVKFVLDLQLSVRDGVQMTSILLSAWRQRWEFGGPTNICSTTGTNRVDLVG